ncbi:MULTISPECIES: hypothetical protein [Megasphaera]|uniref:Uncharacterized protein n=1 Tax=Megasphaera vaginalis (ex Srinivasan et al. 2021) TaxID=1111454 RepID=U7UC78_9FIRM|nr:MULTISPECIES: hypothetical protein [Megasphaera]ERT56921.1 hypothetical protein HMPREF1250_0102 [Megasphaera vaginalis (ex Srinivasan et al. 2021)]
MTLSLFWSRYLVELHAEHLRKIDEEYRFLIAKEKWSWFVSKIPEDIQIRILRGHNHGPSSWTCRMWLNQMLAWLKEDKPQAVYEAVAARIRELDNKGADYFEKTAARSLSQEELAAFRKAGYFLCDQQRQTEY